LSESDSCNCCIKSDSYAIDSRVNRTAVIVVDNLTAVAFGVRVNLTVVAVGINMTATAVAAEV